jgi:hypothetical protein
LALLENVLAFVPVPSLINLSKIFNYQVVALNSVFPLAENTQTFRVNSEMLLIFAVEILDCTHYYRSEFFFHFIEVALGVIHDVVERSLNVITIGSLLLHSKHQFAFDELTLL